MTKLLHVHVPRHPPPLRRRTFSFRPPLLTSPPLPPPHGHHLPLLCSYYVSPPRPLTFSLSLYPPISTAVHSISSLSAITVTPRPSAHRVFSSSSSSQASTKEDEPNFKEESANGAPNSTVEIVEYPSGDFQYAEFGGWKMFVVKLRMLFAFPWERVRKGSVLTMKLRGQITDQLKTRFSSGLSLPQICENFNKAAYDPRISGIYLHIEPLDCGWAKVEEIRRHVMNFRKSGKFVVGYVPTCGQREYYLACACEEFYAPPSAYFRLYGLAVQASFLGGIFEKVGIEPQVERIGKYKSAGDQLSRKSISEENREMLTALLDNIYGNWVDKISSLKGKKKEDVENFVNDGVYRIERLKEDGWITDVKYDDEVTTMLKQRLGLENDKKLPMVDYRTYSRVRKWTLGISGGKEQIAIIRASGSITRVCSPLSSSSSGIVAEQLIETIRKVRESKRFKAAIIRIDSPGGDALASDFVCAMCTFEHFIWMPTIPYVIYIECGGRSSFLQLKNLWSLQCPMWLLVVVTIWRWQQGLLLLKVLH